MSQSTCAARALLGFGALCLALTVSGCLDYREQLTLREDGGGTLQIDFVVNLGLMGEISEALGEKPDPEAMQGPTKDEVLAGVEVDGITVKEIEVEQRGNKSKVHLLVEFKDLASLSQIEGFLDL